MVLKIRVDRRYVSEADWATATKSPKRAVAGWAAQCLGKDKASTLVDAWNFPRHVLNGHDIVSGEMRVHAYVRGQYLQASGRLGVGVDPFRSATDTPTMTVDWLRVVPGEAAPDYLKRAPQEKPVWGLVFGR